MARLSSCYSNILDLTCHGLLLPILLLLLLVLQISSSQLAHSATIVKYLPGFQGPLPFVLETGYVGVGENDDVQAFYYFIKSENNPKKDPLMLWLTGGPGCSVLTGLAFEIGPFSFKIEEYNGSVPNLVLRPQSWTMVSSIIFVDMPATAGYSYARTESTSQGSDWNQVHQIHQFLRKWLIDHPEFLSNEFYIGGDSYSGIPVPVIAHEISQGNEEGVQPWINLQGYVLGNALTTRAEVNYKVQYAHRMGLISDELYQSLQENCRGDYISKDTRSVLCSRDIKSFNELTSEINEAQILEPQCHYYPTNKPLEVSRKRSLTETKPWKLINSRLTTPLLSCRDYGYFLVDQWTNFDVVRKALNVRKETKVKWERCTNTSSYKMTIPSSLPYHVILSRKGYRSLIYSGDHDFSIPHVATQAWITSLNYSIVDDWRQWYSNDQIAGYTRTYSNRMTFATVKGAGHTTPEYKPDESFAMFSRWIWINLLIYPLFPTQYLITTHAENFLLISLSSICW